MQPGSPRFSRKLNFGCKARFLASPRPDALTPPCPRTRRVFRPSTAPAYRDGITGGPGLFAFLHLHPAPLGVVVALAAWMRSQTILAALQGESIQDRESGLPRTRQPVEKLLHAPLRALFEGSTPRFCSVLAVFAERLDTIWSIERSDSEFFNRLEPSTHSGA